MKKYFGFTLLELLVVVVIIAILSVFVLPQLIKGTEKARGAEATNLIGQIRSSLIREKATTDTYSTGDNKWSELDLQMVDKDGATPIDGSSLQVKYWNIAYSSTDGTITATRNSTKGAGHVGETIIMDINGNYDTTSTYTYVQNFVTEAP